MSFGISIGDFIALGNLAMGAYARLQETGGSAADYQSLKLMRRSFGETLVSVETDLQSTNSCSLPKPLVNAARKHLSECSQLLRNFDEITKKYDASLSQGGSGKKVKDYIRKLGWGGMKDATRELFRRLQEHIMAIDMLLTVNNAHRIEELYVISRRKQLAEVPRSLDWSDNKPIKLIDAFDRKITLPYEWCETWEAFHDVLQSGFRGRRERKWVESMAFEIFDEDNKAAMIAPKSWEDAISPGKTLSMSMRLKRQEEPSRGTEQECPSCRTLYKGYENSKALERVRCLKCKTWFQVSSAPRIMELSDDDSVQALVDTAIDEANAMRICRWHIVVEQTEQ